MGDMIRYRIFTLLLLLPSLLTASEDHSEPDKQVLSKSLPYPKKDSIIDTISSWIQTPSVAEEPKKSNEEDLSASATEYRAPKYLPPPINKGSRGRSCYDCNNEPWIPMVGRSLPFPTQSSSHHSTAEQGINKQFNSFYPQIDQYGAPQGSFELPPIGEVVDFMLPPPYKSGSIISGLGDTYNFNFPRPNPAPSFRPVQSFRPPPRRPQNAYLPPVPTTYLRPVTQDFQPPPQPGINQLPLENHLPPPIPSDSYGRPVGHNYGAPLGSQYKAPQYRPPPTNSYRAPLPGPSLYNSDLRPPPPPHNSPFNNNLPPPPPSDSYGDPITLGSGDSEESGYRVLFKPQKTDVQVVPSIKIADYVASIEHPINLIQSPILDLSVNDHKSINEQVQQGLSSYGVDKIESRNRLSENPIVVDDTFTSASDISSSQENATAIKRHNDRFIGSHNHQAKDVDLTDNLIQKLLLEHNIIEDPNTQIVGIKKAAIDPQQVLSNFNLVTPTWSASQYSTPATVMVPPKPVSTWMAPVNESFSKPKKLQIIVPYLKNPGLYNKEYTTLAPVFVPPPVTSEVTNLWTQLDSHKGPAHAFQPPTSTEVYNINDFLAKQTFDLQKNIDDWTHQSYSNRYNFGDKLNTKLSYVKEIPGEYLTTTTTTSEKPVASKLFRALDHDTSSSDKTEFISNEIDVTTAPPTVRYIIKHIKKPSWEEDKVTLSNSTHEKIYVVTPQSYAQLQTSTPPTAFSMAPRIQNGRVNNVASMTRIKVRVEAPVIREDVVRERKPVKVVYSEWPHLINDLETTTTTQRSTSRHPLFGLVDLAPFTLPPNSTVETISGHSKVSTMVTSPITRPSSSSTTPMPNERRSDSAKVLPV